MFFSKILLWIILNNIHFHGTFYIIKPLTHKKWDLQTPRLGERPRFGKAMPFKLMKQALARQWGKNLMDWTGEKHTPDRLGTRKKPMGFWQMLFIFFPWTKKSQFFFVFLGALQCWCMSSVDSICEGWCMIFVLGFRWQMWFFHVG